MSLPEVKQSEGGGVGLYTAVYTCGFQVDFLERDGFEALRPVRSIKMIVARRVPVVNSLKDLADVRQQARLLLIGLVCFYFTCYLFLPTMPEQRNKCRYNNRMSRRRAAFSF